MTIIAFIQSIISLILKIWGWVSGRSKQKLQDERKALEEASRQALLDGDLDATRRARAGIEEIDRRLEYGDY